MTIELTMLALAAVLGLVQIVLSAQSKNSRPATVGQAVRATSRDRL